MTQYLFVILFFTWSCTGRQLDNHSVSSGHDTATEARIDTAFGLEDKAVDTAFIYREVNTDYYHAIYIDTTRKSKFYDRLTEFEFDNNDLQSYRDNYQYVKGKLPNSYQRQKVDIAEHWIPVYQHKSRYYLYAPSDWGNAGRRVINDSAFVYWYMDGPLPRPISNFRKISKTKYKLEIEVFNKSQKKRELTIYTMDPETQLSVFEFSDEPEQYRYQLYIPKENAKFFDMIVNYCDNQKQSEFVFDKIDFEKLINKIR
jgi:hypothetical protein